MTLPEVLLWRDLRKNPQGIKFRRQHPVGQFILDFYCPQAKLGIEIDGIVHDMGNRPDLDEARALWLAEHGITLLRIRATDVLSSLDDVIDAILASCRKL
jgi:very-short-patch-repair endonuclease